MAKIADRNLEWKFYDGKLSKCPPKHGIEIRLGSLRERKRDLSEISCERVLKITGVNLSLQVRKKPSGRYRLAQSFIAFLNFVQPKRLIFRHLIANLHAM